MKTPTRFDRAISKLYQAFHNDELHPECCKRCAVGNICDNTENWIYLTEAHGSLQLSYIGRLNEQFGRRVYGYTPKELLQIETVFLQGCGYEVPLRTNSKKPEVLTKTILFNGLCATVEFLCQLDHIPNVLDYSKLFERENNKPKFQLTVS